MSSERRPDQPEAQRRRRDSGDGGRQKAVVWDEKNLESNAEWIRTHPVTMKIDEPDTPWVYDDDPTIEEQIKKEEEEKATEKEGEGGEGTEGGVSSWDPKYNAVAREAKLHAPVPTSSLLSSSSSVPEPAHSNVEEDNEKDKKKRRPLLVPVKTAVSQEEVQQAEERHKEAEFKHMRKAVYADEGKAFMLLKKKMQEEEEEEEDDEDDK